MTPRALNATVQAPELAEDSRAWLIVDVRTPGEFQGEQIAGSVNAPLDVLDQHAPSIQQAAAGKKVALVCRTGRRAEKACSLLADRQMGDLHVLEGGIVAWGQSGLPLLRSATARMSLERQVRIVAGALVVIGVALGLWVHPGFLGLSAFVGAGLVFAGLTDTCAMGMLLAKMPWNRAPAACAKE